MSRNPKHILAFAAIQCTCHFVGESRVIPSSNGHGVVPGTTNDAIVTIHPFSSELIGKMSTKDKVRSITADNRVGKTKFR